MKKLFTHPASRFLFIAATAYCAWLILYYFVIKEYTNWDYYIDYSIVYLSHSLFGLIGITTMIDIESDHVILMLDRANQIGVWVGDDCNGFKLFSIFAIFILAFPGNWKTKLWFVPMGIIMIQIANVFRVMALLLIYENYPEALDFNHKYTFTIFVYSVIFFLWLWWAKKYSNVKKI